METKRSIPEISVDAQVIYNRLKDTRPGDVITYEELSSLIGRDIQRAARGALYTAIHKAQRDDNAVFACIRKQGIKHLRDTEVIAVGEQAYPHIRRTAKRTIKKLTSVKDFDHMPNESKIRHNTLVSMLGAVAHITGNTQVANLETEVKTGMAALPLGKTLEFFKS